ncbi:hypothetical protein BX616_000607 [Lobosporangium transversale]|uniref:SWIRM domain-domain-containing protein n=1 Tax=Lobosporangium transversale TaxID=64571 RepID=A0A1Y2GLG3_9FUNG|nr:hypothetical protein BCR41DRAFT_354778 [Lobosporangium transversale]KAF9917559.1 hypothetical protein BX616_000607 [Lobosporangium transversale]ORZ14380.1 hypothetical protein BCR41DRAFT_354778 [Lobosporangium transversale]|eukprot:XP_021880858.1 hypothetical protein BCR41DRAFT_354778 [Lobosporangium transversale]
MAARRKSGGADARFYESPDTIAQFERIKDELVRELNKRHPGSDVLLTARELSNFTHALQQFQEDVLGTNNAHLLPSASARIPAKVFRCDVINGSSAIYKALRAAYEYRFAQGWRRWDLSSAARRSQNLELIAHIRQELISQGVIKNPVVAFDDSISEEEREKLESSVERLGGTITSDLDQATHIIHHSSEELESPEGEEWLRTLEKKDGKVLVHYWYYPDSYDEWLLETSSEFMDPEPAPEHTGAWNISARWIRDSEKYNEWMNEEDYEPSSDQASDQESTASSPAPSNQRFGSKRDNSDKTEPNPKRLKRSSSVTPLDLQPDYPGLQVVSLEENAPRGRGSKKNEYEPIIGGDLANIPTIDENILPSRSVSPKNAEAVETVSLQMDLDQMGKEDKGEANPAIVEGGGATEDVGNANQVDAERSRLEEEARQYLSPQSQEVIIPSYAAWFSLSKIHEIEQKSLPEFFNFKNRSKTPTVYKDYRDFMVNTYRLNPSEYLTVTACRRNLAGDVCAIIRVHAFLEQWGLINYQTDPDTRPSTVGPSFTGHFRIAADTPKGLQPFQSRVMPSETAETVDIKSNNEHTGTTKLDPNLALRRNIYTSRPELSSKDNDENAEKKHRFNCFTCGVDCSKNRYHSIKTKNFELCSNCFTQGRFPSTMASGDFIRFQSQHHSADEPWTDQETLLLLEGLEMYGEDWNIIADHVGTRGREQCILHFLQLPIEDPYLESPAQDQLGSRRSQKLPFSESENPVMSVVAFLASVVNPGVAVAAAQSALKTLALAKNDVKTLTEYEATQAIPESSMDMDKSSREEDTNTDRSKEDIDMSDTNASLKEAKANDIEGIPHSILEKAAAAALGSAAAKAKALADYEEREIQRLVTVVVEMQLKKLELKLQQFEELETILDTEKKDLERQREQLYLNRLMMKESIMSMQEKVILARQMGDPRVFANVTVPLGNVAGTGTLFKNETIVRQQQDLGQVAKHPSRDQQDLQVVIQPLP